LASCAIRLHWSLSWAFLLHPSIPISRRSSWTSSSHLSKYGIYVLITNYLKKGPFRETDGCSDFRPCNSANTSTLNDKST
jgi:hypothetical protein